MPSTTILILPAEGPPRVETSTGDSLTILQEAVGGYIESIPTPFLPSPIRRLSVFGYDEARIEGQPRSPWTIVVRDMFGHDCDVLGTLVIKLPRPDHPAIEWARTTYAARTGVPA